MKIKVKKANLISTLFQPLLRSTCKGDPRRFYFRLFGYDVYIVREKNERN